MSHDVRVVCGGGKVGLVCSVYSSIVQYVCRQFLREQWRRRREREEEKILTVLYQLYIYIYWNY